MQAVILVGGRGTRLCPLTLEIPKPMVPICDKPFTEYQLELLLRHGVTRVVFSLGYKWKKFEDYFKEGNRLGMHLDYVVEDTPLGTGGAIKNVEDYLEGETFLVLNGDILSDFNVGEILEYHKSKKAGCTIALTPVEDPTMYGVVEMDRQGKVLAFTEKPAPDEVRSNQINAGLYVMEPKVLELMERDRAYSIEREIFPQMLSNGTPIYGFSYGGYWMDIGTPLKYLKANFDVLRKEIAPPKNLVEGCHYGERVVIDPGARLSPPLWIGRNTIIEKGCVIEGPCVLGKGCHIGEGSILKNTLMWDNCKVGNRCRLDGCLLGSGCMVGDDSSVGFRAVVGSGQKIEPGNSIAPGEKVMNSEECPREA